MSLLSKLLNFFKCDTQGATPVAPVQEVKTEQAVEKAPVKKASKPRQPKTVAVTADAPKAKPTTKSKAKASK